MLKRSLYYLLLGLLMMAAAGCGGSDFDESQVVPGFQPTPSPAFTFPQVDLANGLLPLPNNFLLDPATGLVNLPGGGGTGDNLIDAANTLDGFSTTQSLVIPFRGTVLAASLNSTTLPIFNSVTGAVVPATYEIEEVAEGSVVLATPIRPLDPGTTYLVVLTQGIISATSNTPILSDNVINFIQQPTPLVDGQGNSTTRLLTNEQAAALEPVRQGNQPVIAGAEQLTGTSRANIPFAFAFTTQTLFEALPQARNVVLTAAAPLRNSLPNLPVATGQGINPNDGVTSVDEFWATLPASVQAAPNDSIGAIFAGTIAVPQFRANPLTDFWAQPPVNGGSLNVPFLLFLPATPAPDPAVIFQHSITRNKGDAFILANAFNSQGLAMIAIDLPLHGDLKPSPDLEDGEAFINPARPRVARDNLRQSVVGLYALNNAIFSGRSDLTGDGIPELLPGNIAPPFFLGHSLGSMVGTVYVATEPNTSRAVLNVPGGRITQLLLNSPAFGPELLAGLAAAGVLPNTPAYAQFGLFTQAVLDDVDPLNYAQPAIAGTLRGGVGASLLQQLYTADQTILPESQYDLAVAFGEDASFAQVDALAPLALISQAISPDPGPGVFEIANAAHGSILNPTVGPTAQIITQAITFIGTGNIVPGGLRAKATSQEVAPEDHTPYQHTIRF